MDAQTGLPGESISVPRPRQRSRTIDPEWWTSACHEGRPLADWLIRRDIGVVFRFLKGRGWSVSAITAATDVSENRVRAIQAGRQIVTSYDVLERIATGLKIERGLMGLAYCAARKPE